MGTTIRPELSEKNPYWLEKHRYYELKHFCLQYPIWKKAYSSLDGLATRPSNLSIFVSGNILGDPTARCAIAKVFYSERLNMIKLMIPLMFYGIWMKKGFKFEETGTYTSTTFRGLFNRFRPTKK